MGEKKIQIEAAGRIQDRYGLFKVAAFVSISSSLLSLREIQQEFGGSRSLSHQFLLLLNSPRGHVIRTTELFSPGFHTTCPKRRSRY